MSEDWNSYTASHRTPGPADMVPAPPALLWQLPPVARPFPELPGQTPPCPVFHLSLTLHHPPPDTSLSLSSVSTGSALWNMTSILVARFKNTLSYFLQALAWNPEHLFLQWPHGKSSNSNQNPIVPTASWSYQSISSHTLHVNDSLSNHSISLLLPENFFRYLIMWQKVGIIPSQWPWLLLVCANNVATAFISSWIKIFYFLKILQRNVSPFI